MNNVFKDRVTEAIKYSGYTQKQLSEILKISEGNITNWKKGDNYPSVEVLIELCKLLDESADYLLGLKD